MNAHTLAGILAVAIVALHAIAADPNNQPQQGANAPKPKDEVSAEKVAQERQKRLDQDFQRAKEAEKELEEARKTLDKVKEFKEFADPEVLKKAKLSFDLAEEEFKHMKFMVGQGGVGNDFKPNGEAEAALDAFKKALKEWHDAMSERYGYERQRRAEVEKTGKTPKEVETELKRDPKLQRLEAELDGRMRAQAKAREQFLQDYFEALKKAERQGKYVIEDKTKKQFKATADPKSNEPPGGVKLGGTGYAPPAGGTGGVGLKITPNWDFSGTGQVTNPSKPPFIFFPPYGSSGWEGASPMYPTIPGFMPTVPSGAATPQGSACGCSCKPTCTCKPVCNCKK